MNGGSNLGYILSDNNGYIVSQKNRGASAELKSQVMNDEGWVSLNEEYNFKVKTFNRTVKVTYPDKSKHDHEQKVVCIWSNKYQIKEKHERDNLLDKFATLMSSPTKFKQSCHTGMKKYIDEETVDRHTGEKAVGIKTVTSLNLDKIAEDEALDGYYLLVTSEINVSISEIITKYRVLWRIEEYFRVKKTDLRCRPVFVRTREHVEAHFYHSYHHSNA